MKTFIKNIGGIMKNFKSVFSILVVMIFALLVVACKKTGDEEKEDTTEGTADNPQSTPLINSQVEN